MNSPTTKRLWLWRHAKASVGDPRQSDAERALRPKGLRAAAEMAATHLSDPPDLVLCSPALRARETLSQAEALWTDAPTLRIEADLYLAEPVDLLEFIRQLDEETRSVLIVGHQPGLGELVHLLVGGGEPRALAALARGVRTAALAELRLDIPVWRDAGAECAFLAAFNTPAT
jgi:phosphohistidine phosphatase